MAEAGRRLEYMTKAKKSHKKTSAPAPAAPPTANGPEADAGPDAVNLATLQINDGGQGLPKNPRMIRDERFANLCESIKSRPKFMALKPIVVDENNVILAGNMRCRALRALGYKSVPAAWVRKISDLTPEEKKAFIPLDNNEWGEFDFDILANEYDVAELIQLGFSEKELLDAFPKDIDLKPPDDQGAGGGHVGTIFCPKCGFEFAPGD